MVRQVRVLRDAGVWIVETGSETIACVHGSEAERWGRDRARKIADAGEPAELRVFDLRDRLVGSILFRPRTAAA